MAKMMTYGEANTVLGSSLSPSNRCLSKSVAVNAGAATDPLASYSNNRLVPSSAVQPGYVPTIEHYFVLSDGTYSTNPTIHVGMNDTEAYFNTVFLVDGQIYKETGPLRDWYYKSDWEYDTPGEDLGNLIPSIQTVPAPPSVDSSTGIFTLSTKFKSNSVGVEGAHGKIGVNVWSKTGTASDPYQPIANTTIYITFVRSLEPDPPTPPAPTQWTVTYLGHDGDTFATRTVNDGEAAPNIEIGYTTEDNYVLLNWIDLPASVTSDCTVSGNWVYTPPTPPAQQITVNVKVANAIDDVIYVQDVYITNRNSGDKQISFNGIALNHTEEYTKQGTAYEGTITKVVVHYARSGGQYSKTIPYVDWWTNNSDARKLEEGNTLTIRMNY